MAIAYRTDLFEAAGLPTNREEVSAFGRTGTGTSPPASSMSPRPGRSFVDSGKAIFRAVSNQSDVKYYDEDGNLVFADSPGIREAWDYSMAAIDAGLSADVGTFSPEWFAAMANGGFATLPAPAWMLGVSSSRRPRPPGCGTSPPCLAQPATTAGRSWPSRRTPRTRRKRTTSSPGSRPRSSSWLCSRRAMCSPRRRALHQSVAHRADQPVLQRRAGRQILHRQCGECRRIPDRP